MSQLNYVSGIKLTGILRDVRFSEEGHLQILTFDQAHLSLGKKVLYRPEWGPFDLAIGETIDSLGR
jgi:phenylalanine-4-hydroxylase